MERRSDHGGTVVTGTSSSRPPPRRDATRRAGLVGTRRGQAPNSPRAVRAPFLRRMSVAEARKYSRASGPRNVGKVEASYMYPRARAVLEQLGGPAEPRPPETDGLAGRCVAGRASCARAISSSRRAPGEYRCSQHSCENEWLPISCPALRDRPEERPVGVAGGVEADHEERDPDSRRSSSRSEHPRQEGRQVGRPPLPRRIAAVRR